VITLKAKYFDDIDSLSERFAKDWFQSEGDKLEDPVTQTCNLRQYIIEKVQGVKVMILITHMDKIEHVNLQHFEQDIMQKFEQLSVKDLLFAGKEKCECDIACDHWTKATYDYYTNLYNSL